MDAASIGSSAGPAPQIQAATTAKALDASKQEGEAAVQLIQSATGDNSGGSSGGGPTPTGNAIDIQA